MFSFVKKFIVFILAFEIIYSNFIGGLLIAQETAASLQMEIDSFKNQILKLQADVYTKEQDSEDPECASVTMLLANIEGEILAAEQKQKTVNKDIDRKKEEKKKLQEEIAAYERMYRNDVEKSVIYGMVAAAGIAGMIALGISNKKIQERIDKGEYTKDGARCLQGAGQVDYSSLGRWKNACQMCCLKASDDFKDSCKKDCESAEGEVRKDIEQQVNNAKASHGELSKERDSQKTELGCINTNMGKGMNESYSCPANSDNDKKKE